MFCILEFMCQIICMGHLFFLNKVWYIWPKVQLQSWKQIINFKKLISNSVKKISLLWGYYFCKEKNSFIQYRINGQWPNNTVVSNNVNSDHAPYFSCHDAWHVKMQKKYLSWVTLKPHLLIEVFVVYIDTGSPVPSIPSKSRGLADENKKVLTEWKWIETTVLLVLTLSTSEFSASDWRHVVLLASLNDYMWPFLWNIVFTEITAWVVCVYFS